MGESMTGTLNQGASRVGRQSHPVSTDAATSAVGGAVDLSQRHELPQIVTRSGEVRVDDRSSRLNSSNASTQICTRVRHGN